MTLRSPGTRLSPLCLSLLVLISGCGEEGNALQANQPPPGRRSPSPIGQVMGKLTKGTQSLNALIGKELKADPLDWAAVQPQAEQYVQLTSSMAAMKPPKGSAESWATLTSGFTGSATALDAAVKNKDKDAALAAHKKLTTSCQACHQQHRGGRGG
jgi:cytochrome c556